MLIIAYCTTARDNDNWRRNTKNNKSTRKRVERTTTHGREGTFDTTITRQATRLYFVREVRYECKLRYKHKSEAWVAPQAAVVIVAEHLGVRSIAEVGIVLDVGLARQATGKSSVRKALDRQARKGTIITKMLLVVERGQTL